MCKWTASDVDFDELNLLDRIAPFIEGCDGTQHRFLFSRSGFSRRLAAHAASDPLLTLITPADIYDRAGKSADRDADQESSLDEADLSAAPDSD
jgi:hypothetical protein